MIRLFVYGTLKRGFAAEELMLGAAFEGEATTRPGYTLVDLGAYPALIVAGAGTVTGELYRVSAEHLVHLDQYEGPDYSRRTVGLADGSLAEAYVVPAAIVAGKPRIDGGVWTAQRRGRADF